VEQVKTAINDHPVPESKLLLVIAASAAGTLIEWYDLFLAIILAPVLAENLFPKSDTKFLETLAVVVSSYLIRPVGSLIFGAVGDKRGRKKSFLVSLVLMGAATFLIGCIPGYSMVGWLAPVMLLVLRLAQGMAISGEYAGATIYVAEHAPAGRRGFYTGFIQSTAPFGLLICLSVVFATRALMPPDSFLAYGWRIPFLFSAALVFVSFIIRRRLGESPVYTQLQKEGKVTQSPVNDAFRTPGNANRMLKAIFGGCAAQATLMQTCQFLVLFFLQRAAFLSPNTAILILAVAILLAGPSFQYFGGLSDKYGRKRIMLTGLIISAILIPIAFHLFMQIGNPANLKEVHNISTIAIAELIGLTLLINVASAMVYGPIGAFMLELFPANIRYTSMGFAYNIGNGVLGGSTTLIAELLKKTLIVTAAFAPLIGLIYPLSLVAIAIIVNASSVPETYKNDIDG
jgi:MFS family permease